MAEGEHRKVKEGFLEGMVDGILMKTLWDDQTAKAKKDAAYFIGNQVAVAVQPAASVCVAMDLIRNNYQF